MKAIFAFFLLFISLSLTAQSAYIQIIAEPDVSVFLDNSFKGKTSAELGGLIIENVSPGKHWIKITKEGFNPQEESIVVKPQEVFSYTVQPFTPKIKITQQGNTGRQEINREVGDIKIQSLPVQIQIEIKKLGIRSSKEQDEWKASEVPAGTYDVTFNWKANVFNTTLTVKPNTLTSILVDMIKKELKTIEYIETHSSDVQTINNTSKVPDQTTTMILESFDDDDEIITVVESMPEFPGGVGKMVEFISKTTNYPSNARTKGIQGMVFLTFNIEKDGIYIKKKKLSRQGQNQQDRRTGIC